MSYTLTDPDLTHQVVFMVYKGHVAVSCNCLIAGTPGSSIIQVIDGEGLDVARKLYNDASLHKKPFGVEDKAKW